MESAPEISERRRQTRSAIFHYIYSSATPRSKQDIAKDLNLSLPTVYQNVAELTEAGYIEAGGFRHSSGGRPARYLQAVMDAKCAIGVSILSHRLRILATDLSRTVTAYKDTRHAMNVEDPEYGAFVAQEIETFIEEKGIDRARILGVGISLAGIVGRENDTVLHAPTLYLKNLSFKNLIDAIPYPVFIDNDANSGGLAEWYQSGESGDFAYLSLCEGVGGTVIVNGNQYTGRNNRSGEFGHMCVEPNGRLCSCGTRGCLEAYCSDYRFKDDLGLSYTEFFEKLRAGEPDCVSLWEDYKRRLVTGIRNVRMALDCDVVLGGFLSEYIAPYIEDIREELKKEDPFDPQCTYLRIGHFPRYSSMLGVALVFIRRFLESV